MASEKKSEPSVESSDKEERIKARRKRLKHQMQELKTSQLPSYINLLIEEEIKKSEMYIQDSKQRLRKLYRDGTELISNLSITASLHEATRRFEEEAASQKRREKLEVAADEVEKKFKETMSKWEEVKEEHVPQKLYQLLLEQKSACEELIQERNKIIAGLKDELKKKDMEYIQNLRKQEDDMSLVCQRIDQLIKNLGKASKEEMHHIEAALDEERNALLTSTLKTWEKALLEVKQKDEAYAEELEKGAEEQGEELYKAELLETEEYTALRTQLENDVHSLELQLQQMKAIYLLNQDKLEYSFQVLRKRKEENMLIKSELKRNLTFLHDRSSNLKTEIEQIDQESKEKYHRLKVDCKRIEEQIPILSKTARHFHAMDTERFSEVFKAKEAEARDLVEQVLNVDQLIYEELLGINWEPPDLTFLERNASFATLADVKFSDSSLAKEPSSFQNLTVTPPPTPQMRSDSSLPSVDPAFDTEELEQKLRPKPDSQKLKMVRPPEMKKLLEFITDEMGFLVEERVLQLLEPVASSEGVFMTLNAIFRAIAVFTSDDVTELTYYMIKHSKQSNIEGEVLLTSKDVLEAIKEYLKEHKTKEKQTIISIDKSSSQDFREHPKFWKPYSEILPETTQGIWDALLYGMEKYYRALRKRAQLLQSRSYLMHQNKELGGLLYYYLQHEGSEEDGLPHI